MEAVSWLHGQQYWTNAGVQENGLITPEALIRDYPKIEDLDWHWVADWYDGPISGTAAVDGKEIWGIMCDELDSGQRLYQVITPDPESWTGIERRREAFNKYVGTHWDFTVPQEERSVRPMDLHSKYYAMFSPSEKWEVTGKTIGWYRW